MGKGKNTSKAGGGLQMDAFPTLSSHGGEPEDTVQDLIEEVSLPMGLSPKAAFMFTQLSRLPSIHSLSPNGRQVHSATPDNWICYWVSKGERHPNLHLPTHGVDH